MALQARRFHGKPLLQPNYNFRDVPFCARDLSGSTLSVVTERQHLVDSIAELTLLCNEATRRKKPDPSTAAPSSKKTTKPLSIEYIFDRIDTDDPIWGLMVRTDTPMSLKGRASNMKASPHWKRGMLQGFITMTTFTNWQSSFRFDSVHEMAFGQDDDDLEDQMNAGLRKYDEDGSLAEELEALVKGGNPHLEGIVYPRIAEVSLFGGLGCGKQLLRLLIEHLECMKATASQNYDYILLQATDNSIPFYEAMGFTRVGCVQGKAPSPNAYHSGPVEEYITKKNGETPLSIAKEFGVDVWDVVFLNKPIYQELVQKSWLKLGTTIFVPKPQSAGNVAASVTGKGAAKTAPKWYIAKENDTPRGIAKKFQLNFGEMIAANRTRYPDLVGNSKLMEGTRIQISRFDFDEGDTIAYSHWTFPDADQEDNEPSYMMALKLNRKKGNEAKVKPVAESLSVKMEPYSPEATGVKDLLLKPKVPAACAPLAPVFTKQKAPKEPKKPKRPTTSYGHFTSDFRITNAKELEGKTLGEINKILSEEWKVVSEKDKLRYQKLSEQSKAEYHQAMKKYEEEMVHYRRETPQDTTNLKLGQVDTSLLEKVVKLKSTDGISGASKFEYYYVLTFIPDLQWVHLIPMRKVGVFGSEFPDACGRSIWMIVGEDEGKEIDTTASLCLPVTALTMKNSADADDEQWDIYDNGEKPPPPRPIPAFTPKATTTAVSAAPVTGAPVRPKKPATSFAFFCADAKTIMQDQLENKLIADRTRIIAERWKTMTDEEKQKYKDKNARATEKYSKAMKRYKKDLEKFLELNPGAMPPSAGASSSKTPKSSKKVKFPPEAVAHSAKSGDGGDSQKKKRGRPRIHPLPDSEAEGTPTPRKRGRPRKSAEGTTPTPNNERARRNKNTPPNYYESDEDDEMPKRKRGRPSKDAIHQQVELHTVKKDPVELEKLLGKLKSNKNQKTVSRYVASDEIGENDVVLSLTSLFYRNSMWKQYSILGTARDSKREKEVSNEVFTLFKEHMGQNGRFFKRVNEKNMEVDDDTARQKIIADIRRRGDSSGWLKGTGGQESSGENESPPESISHDQAGDNDIVLSLLNEKYKDIMWRHFRTLGKPQKGGCGEEELGREILQSLKKGVKRGGRIFKKLPRGDELVQVSDDQALQKIIRDLKRRMESSHNWLKGDGDKLQVEDRPLSSPTRSARRRNQPNLSSRDMAVAKPSLTPSRYPKRGAQPEVDPEVVDKEQSSSPKNKTSPLRRHSGDEDNHLPSSPAEGLPDGWLKRRVPRKNPRDKRIDTRWYSPELNLRFRTFHDAKSFAQRVEALGKGEAAAMLPMSPKDSAKSKRASSNRPLAPIFLKSYGKRKKSQATSETSANPGDSSEAPIITSPRYPVRKRKQITDDDNLVSDASEATQDSQEPRKKRAKTQI